MPILDKAKVAIGIQKKTKLDLSHSHITTSNFMDMQPICYRHMIPQEHYKVSAHAFARLAPLTVPTYGRCRLNLRAFFVPFRTVMPLFNDFIVDTVSTGPHHQSSLVPPPVGIVSSTPYFTNADLLDCFTNRTVSIGGVSYPFTKSSTSSNYDYFSSGDYRKFTPLGRKFWKILRSLGYHMSPTTKGDKSFSALALLAYLRVYFDWYSVSAYMDTSSYLLFDSWFKYNDPTSPLHLNAYDLSGIALFLMRVSYDGDYFTAAWDNPNEPNDSLFSDFKLVNIDSVSSAMGTNPYTYSENGYVSNNSGSVSSSNRIGGADAPFIVPQISGVQGSTNIGAVTPISEYLLHSLHALTDYMKRHQLSGARTIDRYLADFGINLPADKLNRSTYLGMSSIDIKIGDVMSHSNTSSDPSISNLGDYAGQGIANGGKSFDYVAQEFGLFIIVSSILPSGGYVQGIDRNNLHLTKDAFFLPDFDNLGVQAISRSELYISKNEGFAGDNSDYDVAFGYTPRYAEYKIARDQVTGDFATSVMSGGDSWHLSRLFDDAYFSNSVSNVQHDLDFCLGNDADQYSRIFNNTDADVDKFYIVYQFDAAAIAPCNSLFDTYQFENEGKKITMDSNGVKMN